MEIDFKIMILEKYRFYRVTAYMIIIINSIIVLVVVNIVIVDLVMIKEWNKKVSVLV